MMRTPYSVAPYGVDKYRENLGPSENFARERWMSEGDFVDVRPYIAVKRSPQDVDESSDAYDTIEWLVKRVPHHNGRVGIGGSPTRGSMPPWP